MDDDADRQVRLDQPGEGPGIPAGPAARPATALYQSKIWRQKKCASTSGWESVRWASVAFSATVVQLGPTWFSDTGGVSPTMAVAMAFSLAASVRPGCAVHASS